jgi:uncharacterized protein (DUF1697 family)
MAITAFVALLRAVNVGGTGKLPMTTLASMCEACGFTNVKTYIASGNVVFLAKQTEANVKKLLEAKLLAYAASPVSVMVRSAEELAQVRSDNPFRAAAKNRAVVLFCDATVSADVIKNAAGRKNEEIALGKREVYIHYGEGMADSKLKLSAMKEGTARNLNTVAKLVAMSAALLQKP